MDHPDTAAFLDELSRSLVGGSFVKLSLGKGRGGYLRATARCVTLRDQPHLTVTLERERAGDLIENHPVAGAGEAVRALLAEHFGNAHLFTTAADIELRTNRRGEPHLSRGKPSFHEAPAAGEHNRARNYLIDPARARWLHALGVVGEGGKVKGDKADKYRQLQNLLRILDELVSRSELGTRPRPRVVDMGSGKGYLTFAVHDYFRSRGVEAEVVGVDRNAELVALCEGVARRLGLAGLTFQCGDVESFREGPIDLLIALHACDTATDVAIYKGIAAGAAVIVTVPCCQHELRPQFKAPAAEQPLFKHDTFKDRFCQTLTDALRGLLMESRGYRTRIMEFISDAHTHRNVLIAGVYGSDYRPSTQRLEEVRALKARYGIERQHLESLLSGHSPSEAARSDGPTVTSP